MRAWVGNELEGVDRGVKTLFVRGCSVDCAKVIEILEKYDDVCRVYFGAGREDLLEIEKIGDLLLYTSGSIELICEVSLSGLTAFTEMTKEFEAFDQVIVRMDNPLFDALGLSDVVKIDSGDDVYTVTLERMDHTALEDLNVDMFEGTDVLVYNDLEGGFI
jgi:hypothetical protein